MNWIHILGETILAVALYVQGRNNDNRSKRRTIFNRALAHAQAALKAVEKRRAPSSDKGREERWIALINDALAALGGPPMTKKEMGEAITYLWTKVGDP